MLTLRQEGLLSMALQELVWASAVHAIGMAKGGCRLNLVDTQLILSGVNSPIVLHNLASIKCLRVRLKGQPSTHTLERYRGCFGVGAWYAGSRL